MAAIDARRALAALAIVSLVLGPSFAHAQSVLDQSQDQYQSWGGIFGSSNRAWQTFTPGVSAPLTSVQLVLDKTGSIEPATLTVEIRLSNATGNLFTLLASATVDPSTVSTSPAWTTVTFASPPSLSTGQIYAIRLVSTGSSPSGYWRCYDSHGNPYSGGLEYYSDSMMTYTLTDVDFAFRTYMNTNGCGDGVVSGGEQCDDGNFVNGDCCSATCHADTGSACTDDGLFCTTDVCDAAGTCSHPGRNCDDGNVCTSDSCDESANTCQFDPDAGHPCADDGLFCTNDVCNGSGTCTHPDLVCDDGNECTSDFCDEADNSCGATPTAGAPCSDDGLFCTSNVCDSDGACTHPDLVCNDGNECTDDSCDESAAACSFTPRTGQTCSDEGIFCTADVCDGSGTCTHTGFACDDGIACTEDTCDESTDSCSNEPNDSLCNDDSICTTDSCDASAGCVFEPAPDPSCEHVAPGKAQLAIWNAPPEHVQVKWKWTGSFDIADLGTPTVDSGYALCVFNDFGTAAKLTIPAASMCAGKPCWEIKEGVGVSYKDKTKPATYDGVSSIKAKADTGGKAQISLVASGANVPALSTAPFLAGDVVVQMHADGGSCWQSVFTDWKQNEATRYKASVKAP